MSEPTTDAAKERFFKVAFLKCTVTGEFDKCISVRLGQIQRDDGQVAEVYGNFSERALLSMLTDLHGAPDPVLVPSHETVQEQTPYQWATVSNDGEAMQQFPKDGLEYPFRDLKLEEVDELWLVPKVEGSDLPWYAITRATGFVQMIGETCVNLPLPVPDEPFTIHYFRRVSVTTVTCNGEQDSLPPHVVQVIGWQTGDRVFEIGVEPDGSYTVWKDEPLEKGG